MLIANKITKSYEHDQILKGVDIKIEPGKITSLIGPSGCGKTTTLRTLSMLDWPDSGEIILDDKKYLFPADRNITIAPWPTISVVFQQLFLWPHLTIRQNILMPTKGSFDAEYFNELVDTFQIKDLLERYPNQVSLGQRQRIAFIRALILKPKYLLLDEITSALDVEQIAEVLRYIQILKKRGMGILIVTHLLNFAQRASDQIIFMDAGKIIEANGKELLEKPKQPRVQRFLSLIKTAT